MHHTFLPQTEFNAILNSIPDVLIRLTLNGRVLWWNKNLHDILSLTKDELLLSQFTDLFKIHNGEIISNIIADTVDSGSAEIDAFLITALGEKRYHLKCTLIESSNTEEEVEVLVVARDISEQSQMSGALIQSQSLIQNLIDTLPFLVFLTTTDNIYLIANKKFCEFVGLSNNNIIGFKSSDIFDGDILECYSRDNEKILLEKCSVHYESSLILNGKNISLSIDKFPLFDEQNNIYAVCGVIEDVTAQYQLQRQLQQTQKMEAIGQLSGGIAHDFNNVLASIMGYTGLTKRRIVKFNDETVVGYIDQITRAGERARDLVQQLLAFSRGDVSGLKILDPTPLAKEAISMLSSLIPSSINLNFKIKNNILNKYIEVDPVQFNQSIMNLVINSKDAIGDVTGEINVSLDYSSDVKGLCDSCHVTFSGDFIKLTVSDSGTGISQEILGRVFDPFFTTKDIGKGSGMGLSMLHGIVHGSGGHIVIKSKNSFSEKGTMIEVYFPEVLSTNIQENIGKYQTGNTKNQYIGRLILVIDDEPLIINYLSDLLMDEGYKVISYTDSEKGLDYFYKNKDEIDLVITDQTMPNLTGIEMAKTIFKSGCEMPIILCSGYSDIDIAGDLVKVNSGIDVFLDKPFNNELLLGNISTLLKKYNKTP